MAQVQVSDIEFKSYKAEIAKIAESDILAWLAAIGEDASHTAAEKAPVDTGRLKNSISWATQQAHGGGTSVPNNTPEKNSVYIGTNVKNEKGVNYAIYQELGTSRIAGKHFLQFGATAHANEYGKLLENLMKQ